MRFLDTNILIRYATKDDEQKAAASYLLLQRLESGEETAITSDVVIAEAVYVLQSKAYNVSRDRIRRLLAPVIESQGLRLPSKPVYTRAFDFYCAVNISFTDAFNAAYMEAEGVDEIYSYDTDFNKIPRIRRVEPKR